MPSPLPKPPKVTKTEPVSLKRSAPDDDEVVVSEPPAKRARTNGAPGATATASVSSKLEEDGIEIIEEDDVIIIE